MKTQLKPIIWFLALLVLLAASHLASGYYDPGLQRWLTRDPIEDLGFTRARATRWSEPNCCKMVGNNPVNAMDPEGLVIWDSGPCVSLAFAVLCHDICASQGLLDVCRHMEERTITPTSGGYVTTVSTWDECTCKQPPPKPPPPGGPPNCKRNAPPPIVVTGPPPRQRQPPLSFPPWPPGGGRSWP
jgi:RHS repeat-associated protein